MSVLPCGIVSRYENNPTDVASDVHGDAPGIGRGVKGYAGSSEEIPVGSELYSVRGEYVRDLPGTVTAVAKWAMRSWSSGRLTSNGLRLKPGTSASFSTISASSATRRTTAERSHAGDLESDRAESDHRE